MKQAERARTKRKEGVPRLLPSEWEPMRIEDIHNALVIRERDLFLITETSGGVPLGNPSGYGLYYNDMRHLSCFEFSFSASAAMVLLSTAEKGFSSEQVITNFWMKDARGREVPKGTIQAHRTRVIEDVLEETLELISFNNFPVDLDLTFRFAADFADIFVVRGFVPERRGSLQPPTWADGALHMRYKGADGHTRQTMVMFSPKPDSVQTSEEAAIVTFRASLAPRESTVIRTIVSPCGRLERPLGDARFQIVAREYERWRKECTRVRSDNYFFDAVLGRSMSDLRMLWNYTHQGSHHIAAGTPWYDAMFGRDSCIAGLQTLWLKPDIARHCLASLARWQGKTFDSWRDEEPGKIPHELRTGECTQSGELPFSPYYGSIDSTPLFLELAGEYFRWTADTEMMSYLEANLRAGLHWLDQYGDMDHDGYLEYEKRSARGLLNQGWKDSEHCIIHDDGTALKPPIALVEVQAYVYSALQKLAPVFSALGDEETADDLRLRAAAMAERFQRDFWMDGYLALALDGDKRPSAAVSSNAGHALWTGIATEHQAGLVAARLMEDDMYSGWGIRTLSSRSPRYNPQGYHVGTVWPHDNSLIAMGFKRFGLEHHLNTLATAIFEAARSFQYYRLPELYGGSPRSAHGSPVPYPVACRPQAWAAGAFPLIAQALLGLCPDAANHRLYIVRPQLPGWLHRVRVDGLRVGQAQADLLYDRAGSRTVVTVLSAPHDLAVEVRDDWPMP